MNTTKNFNLGLQDTAEIPGVGRGIVVGWGERKGESYNRIKLEATGKVVTAYAGDAYKIDVNNGVFGSK